MAALMHPLMGGIVSAHSASTRASDSSHDTSHRGATTCTPRPVSSETSSDAAAEAAPDRDGSIKCLAPLSTIHRAIARPRPPDPPAIRYDACSSNLHDGRSSSSCGTTSARSSVIMMRPMFLPPCSCRNACSTSETGYLCSGPGWRILPSASRPTVPLSSFDVSSRSACATWRRSTAEKLTLCAKLPIGSIELDRMSASAISMKRPNGAMHSQDARSPSPDSELNTTSTPYPPVTRLIPCANDVSRL